MSGRTTRWRTVAHSRDGEVDNADLDTFGLDDVVDATDAVPQFGLFCWPHEHVQPVEIAVLKLQGRLGGGQRNRNLLNHWARLTVRGELKFAN